MIRNGKDKYPNKDKNWMTKDSVKKELPMVDSVEIPESLDCTTCLLPMQYQKKVDGKFVWQCFRCGKRYFVFTENGKTTIEETWGPPR
tara:strand:+ start:231 stop:494 length:264 start_codon:yes stop_codon:yes gene_type:complete